MSFLKNQKEVLKMRKKYITKLVNTGLVAIIFSLLICSVLIIGAMANEETVYEITANIIGPGPVGIKKAENIELAANELNRILENAGAPIRVKVTVDFSALKWDPFADKFYMDFKAGQAPDIFTLRNMVELAKGGFIISLDDHVKSFWDSNYYDFYPNLWESATWDNKVWGIPHDISPTGVWYRKDVLRKLGYSDEDIVKLLPPDGSTTLGKLAELAKKAVDAGLVEYGILHRPSSGSGFYGILLAFGAEAYNINTDSLVLNKSAMLNMYKWHADMVKAKVIPPEPPPWSTIHSTFVEGKTFCTMASHVGTPAEWKEAYGLTDEALENDIDFLPFPPAVEGVNPVSVHDFPLYFISSQCKHPEIAALLIMFATSPQACAIHSEYSMRPPYRTSGLYYPTIEHIEYIQRIAPSAKTVRPVPTHADFWTYMNRAFDALKGVEAGIITSAQAISDLENFAATLEGMEIKD